MKKLFPSLLLSALLILSWDSFSLALDTDKAGRLQIIDGAVCLKISSLKCLGNSTQFPSDVGKLYCITRIAGALNPTSVTHVWYFGTAERWRINLAVKSASWRTYSSKIIHPQETGDWSVETLGPQGETLGLYKFIVYPEPGGTGRTRISHTPQAEKRAAPAKKAAPADDDKDLPAGTHARSPAIRRGAYRVTGDRKTTPATGIARHPSYERAKSARNKTLKTIGKKIDLETGENGIDRLYIDLNRYTTPFVLVLGGAVPKVAVHIMDVSVWDGLPEIAINGEIIKHVRSKLHYSSGTLRILLDLDPDINYSIKSYRESKNIYCVEASKNVPGK